MKRLCTIMFCLVIAMTMILPGYLRAENTFPVFNTSLIRLYIPIEAISFSYQEDLEHEVGFNFSYDINGQLFTDPSQGHIQSLTEGFTGVTDRSTPWETLSELLAAYQTSNIDAVKALYTSDSLPIIHEWFSDPSIEEKFASFMASVKEMNVLLGFEHKNGFLVLVNADYGVDDPVFDKDVTPFFFVHSGSEYLLSSVILNEAIDTNISIFLQTGHSVAELPAPKHGLSVEKIGLGDGVVEGSGIDCGEDCIEVYVEGSAVWLKATPDVYSTFGGWQLDGEALEERLVMKEDTIVSAVFNAIPPKECTVTVENIGTGAGTVISGDTACDSAACLELFSFYAGTEEAPVVVHGIDCGEHCRITYTEGTTMYLNAVADEGSEFTGWQVNGEMIAEPFELTENITILAVFDEVSVPEGEDLTEEQP